MSRLTGAWVIDSDEVDKVELLVAERRVLATFTGQETLNQLGIAVSEHIDPDVTVNNLEKACDELRAAYEAHTNRHKLVAPTLPSLPNRIDMQDPPSMISDEPTQVALALARWLAQVATNWDRIEGERVIRTYIPGGRTRRPTPIAVRKPA